MFLGIPTVLVPAGLDQIISKIIEVSAVLCSSGLGEAQSSWVIIIERNLCLWFVADPVSLVRDHSVKQGLAEQGISVRTFNGDLLHEPWQVYDDNGQAFTVFNAYWQKCLNLPYEPEAPVLPPRRLTGPIGKPSGTMSGLFGSCSPCTK